MEIFALALLVPAVLKVIGTTNAIRWLVRHGDDYRVALDEMLVRRNDPLSEREHFALLDGLEGTRFFPFGQKDFRLRRIRLAESGSRGGRAKRGTVGLLYGMFYRLHRLTLLSCVYVVIVSSVVSSGDDPFVLPRAMVPWILFTLMATLLVCALAQATESVYSHSILGGYGAPFHMLGHGTRDSFLTEIRVLVGCLANTALAATGAVYVSGVNLASFKGFPNGPVHSLTDIATRLVTSVYFVTTCLSTVGFGDVAPRTSVARLVVITIEVSGFAFIVLGLAALSGASVRRSDPLPETELTPPAGLD